MEIRKTRRGVRLIQHGVVVSELRVTPGPTHSVFDGLAGLVSLFAPGGPVGLLGFAGGGMMAPLRALSYPGVIATVDLDRAAFEVFRAHCPAWQAHVNWTQGDAAAWLQAQRRPFGVLVDDLSIPVAGEVIKPDFCWTTLPELMRRRLKGGGVAVVNLLPGPGNRWPREYSKRWQMFAETREVRFAAYENRVVVAGANLPSAGELGQKLRRELERLGSSQARQVSVCRL